MTTADIVIGQGLYPLFSNRDPFVFVEGPRGTAKTRGILTILMLRGAMYPGARVPLWRSTRTRLSQTVLETFEKQVIPLFRNVQGMRLANPGAGAANRTSYKFENGTEFIPIGLDDPLRSTSLEAAFGYLAEGIELKRQDDALALAGALRQDIGAPFHQLIIDANPGPPAHFLNQWAEPIPKQLRIVRNRADYDRLQVYNRTPAADPLDRIKRLVTKHMDNPGYFDVDSWTYTTLGEQYVKNTLEALKGHLRRRWLDGEWVSAEGAVFPEFDEEIHVIEPFAIPREWPCWLAEDPGFDHPTAIEVAACAPNGRLYVCAEYVERLTTVKQDADFIKRSLIPNFNIVRLLGDPHYMFSKNKHNSGKSIASQMQDNGLRFIPAPAAANQTEINQQIDLIRTKLTTLGSDGKPMLQFFRCVPNMIRGMQTLAYERNAKGEMTGGEDRIEDVGDDEVDTLRMIVASNPRPAGQGKTQAFGG